MCTSKTNKEKQHRGFIFGIQEGYPIRDSCFFFYIYFKLLLFISNFELLIPHPAITPIPQSVTNSKVSPNCHQFKASWQIHQKKLSSYQASSLQYPSLLHIPTVHPLAASFSFTRLHTPHFSSCLIGRTMFEAPEPDVTSPSSEESEFGES